MTLTELRHTFASAEIGSVVVMSSGGVYVQGPKGSWYNRKGPTVISDSLVNVLYKNPGIVWCLC